MSSDRTTPGDATMELKFALICLTNAYYKYCLCWRMEHPENLYYIYIVIKNDELGDSIWMR